LTRSAIATNLTNLGAIYVKDNLIYGVSGILGAQDPEIEAIQINTLNADPMFVNSALFDFNLTNTSTAINSADPVYAPTTDFYGNSRNVPDIGAIEFINPLDAGEIEQESVKIYPNPFEQNLIIETTKSLETAEIYTMLGQLISVIELSLGKNIIDMLSLENGVYFVRVGSDVMKIVKKSY
jgi:hypothetical protein